MNNIKLLYVEDEEITRIITKKMLKEFIGKLFVGKDGKEGLELFIKNRPQIIISDLRMPNMNGIEMIKKIRDIDQECGIIINTEVEDIEYIIKSVDIGIDKYLVKPIEKEEMLQSLNKVLLKVINRKKSNNKLYEISQLSKVERKIIEDEIKTKISFLLKKLTGKGPKDVQVFFIGSVVEVKTYDALTLMEKTLLNNRDNFMLVEYYRKLFYKEIDNYLIEIISKTIGFVVKLNKININVNENMEHIIFEIQFDKVVGSGNNNLKDVE
ncbi:Na-translocating system protein MpsC family protein [Clostridium lundense]|uniref:Na-translocating system protein MpsC family protein n=1 Tax=Clostridium lundense TaxID=319475 RepID=UPI001FA754C4|nr:Na-translocating system protein MpsC family protein [Clostridium lundense]